MKKYFEQLTPQERRIVVGVGLLVFLLLNYFFVWGRFGEWGREVARMHLAESKAGTWDSEIRRQREYENKIKQLEDTGSQVSTEDQAIDLTRFINGRANENQVLVVSSGRPNVKTNNPYIVEREVGLQVQASENHLVDFLYSLGSGSSAVRVRSMALHPDGSQQELSANLTLVASYVAKPKTRTPAPAAAPADKVPPKTAPKTTPGPTTAAGPTNKPPANPRSAVLTNKANQNR